MADRQTDSRLSSLELKTNGSVRDVETDIASTGNIVLTSIGNSQYTITETAIDGVNLIFNAGQRIFLKDQTTPSEMGVYVIVAQTPFTLQLASDFNTNELFNNTRVQVLSGGTNAGKFYLCEVSAGVKSVIDTNGALNDLTSIVHYTVKDMGYWDASGNNLPTTGGSGTGGIILQGDEFTINGAGIVSGQSLNIGDRIRAKQDNPAGINSWKVLTTSGSLSSNQDVNISGLVDKDMLVYNNTSHKWENKTTADVKGNLSLDNVTNDAQLKRSAGDIASFTEKITLVDDDILLIEDSENTNVKKKVKKSAVVANLQKVITSPVLDQILTDDGTGQSKDSGRVFNDGGVTTNDIWSGAQTLQTIISVPNLGTVNFATTANDTLSGLSARDGYTPVAGNVALVKNQTNGDNSFYITASGAWTRAYFDSNTSSFLAITTQTKYSDLHINNGVVNVLNGTVNKNLQYQIFVTDQNATLGTGKVIVNATTKLPISDPYSRWVNTNIGNDTNNNGSQSFPYTTISKALTGAQYPHVLTIYGQNITENLTLSSSMSNITIQVPDLNDSSGKTILSGTWATSSGFTRGRFIGHYFSTGTNPCFTLGAGDAGRHLFKNCIFVTTGTDLMTINTSGTNEIVIDNPDASSSVYASLNLTAGSSPRILYLRNIRNRFTLGTIGANWYVIIEDSCSAGAIVYKGTISGTIIDRRSYLVNAIIADQTALNTLLADTSTATDGFYTTSFSPTGVTGAVKGDILLKQSVNGVATDISVTCKYNDVPEGAIKVLNGSVAVAYVATTNGWGQPTTSVGTVPYETDVNQIKMDGTRSLGSSNNVPRSDHVHATDTTRAGLADANIFTDSNVFNSSVEMKSTVKVTNPATSTNNYANYTDLVIDTDTKLAKLKPIERVKFQSGMPQIAANLLFIYKNQIWATGRGFSELGLAGENRRYIASPLVFPSTTAITGWSDLVFHYNSAIALTNDGRVFQWGDLINSAIPTQLSFGAGVTIASIYGCSARGVALSGTQDRAATFAAVDTNGKIYLWGNNIWGQCGTGNATTPVTTPTTPTALANKVITKVSFSASLGIHVGAIDSTGQLYMWGYGGNVSGCTPLGTGVGATNYNTPQAISGMTNVTDVVCASCYDNTWSRNITRILRADGSSWACGTNSSGELADSTLSNRAVFVREALSKTNIVAIYAGAVANGAMTAIVDSNGILYLSGKNHDQCFGDNTASGNAHTSFGNNATMSSAGFQGKMLNNTGIKPKICVTGDVYNGYCTMGILDNTGTFYVAGFNSQGQCGVGNTTQVATWTKPLLPAGKVVYDFTTHGYTSTDMGFTVACTDGSIYSWGGTTAGGVLGVESVNLGVNFTIPVPVIGFE